jgi:hypothetical protein
MPKVYPDDVRRQAKVMWLSGNYRSDKAICAALGINRESTIKDWRKKEGWKTEREALEKETQNKVNHVLAEGIAEMHRRHVKMYQGMQSKGVQALVHTEPRSVGDAVSLLDTGIKGERLVTGEPTEIKEVRGLLLANIKIVETVVGEIFQELLRDRRIRREDAQYFAEQFASRINKAPFRLTMDAVADNG